MRFQSTVSLSAHLSGCTPGEHPDDLARLHMFNASQACAAFWQPIGQGTLKESIARLLQSFPAAPFPKSSRMCWGMPDRISQPLTVEKCMRPHC